MLDVVVDSDGRETIVPAASFDEPSGRHYWQVAGHEAYVRDGVVLPGVDMPLLSGALVTALQQRLERVIFHTEYDTGIPPTKPVKGNLVRRALQQREKIAKRHGKVKDADDATCETLQMINIRYCDSLFQQLVHSTVLGEIVANVTGWPSGARVAQDQVWVKPPRCGPLTFHRDSPYFDFQPSDVATVWITLDPLDGEDADELGPLQYCPGSHRWGDSRTGSAGQFFTGNYKALLYDAARREGLLPPPGEEGQEQSSSKAELLPIVTVRVKAGGFSIHDGRTWHGSGPNRSTECRYRRGIGIHFVPGCARFAPDKPIGRLWLPYLNMVKDGTQGEEEEGNVVVDRPMSLPETYFPLVGRPKTG